MDVAVIVKGEQQEGAMARIGRFLADPGPKHPSPRRLLVAVSCAQDRGRRECPDSLPSTQVPYIILRYLSIPSRPIQPYSLSPTDQASKWVPRPLLVGDGAPGTTASTRWRYSAARGGARAGPRQDTRAFWLSAIVASRVLATT